MLRWSILLACSVLVAQERALANAETTTTSSTTTTTVQACDRPATVELWAENESGQPSVTLDVGGTLDGEATTCNGGAAFRTSYAATLRCAGSGLVRCTDAQGAPARIDGLQPGAWVHRLTAMVASAAGEPANDPQQQARRGVVVGPSATVDATTKLVWTLYGYSRAITSDHPGDLRDAIRSASGWTASHPGRHALLALRPPGRITFADQDGCPPDTACDPHLTSPKAGICVHGDRLVLDGRDDEGRRAAELSAGASIQPVVRVYGADVELRGLVLVGSTSTGPQADTLSFMSDARRSVLVDSTVVGPASGDGIGSCGGGSDADANLVVDSLIRNAADKGVKVSGGGVQVVSGSCVRDNANGGIQATLGGRVIARENVVQHNVPAGAENGIFANDSPDAPSSVVTRGNIVRFAGERGLSVVDNSVGDFHDDYVARNQYTGGRVETTRTGAAPLASFTGVAFVCNRVAFVSATCVPEGQSSGSTACIDDGDCAEHEHCKTTVPAGVGLGIQFPKPCPACTGAACTPCSHPCACDSPPCPCLPPAVTLIAVAMTRNRRNESGANLQLNTPGATVAAGATQWEGCTSAGCDDTAEATVRAANVREAAGAHVDLHPVVATNTLTPGLTSVTPLRPRAGQIVRVYGRGFDAIRGNELTDACEDSPPRDADFCDPSETELARLNRSSGGNRLRLVIGAQSLGLDLVAVTPTMLAFRMPVDCFAPASIELHPASPGPVLRIAACDPEGCEGQPAGILCTDDGNACTDDVCDGAGRCTHAPRPAGTTCRASRGTCDPAEVCDGAGSACPPDAKYTPGHLCRAAAGACDRPETCNGTDDECPADELRDTTRICRAATGPCDVAESCDGMSAVCPPNALRPAGAECRAAAEVCDVAETCDGVGASCPADGVRPAGTECRAAAGVCDLPESCDGHSATCPADAKSTAGCRAAAGPCDAAELCDGAANACPADAKQPPDRLCRASAGPCDLVEHCDGSNDACPADRLAASGAVCRRARDACDFAETCTGTTPGCPADARAMGFDAIGCRRAEVDGGIAQACGPKRKRMATLLARAMAVLAGADDACAAGHVHGARARLRHVARLLARLQRSGASDSCLRGLGLPTIVEGLTGQVHDLMQTLPSLCPRRRDPARRRRPR